MVMSTRSAPTGGDEASGRLCLNTPRDLRRSPHDSPPHSSLAWSLAEKLNSRHAEPSGKRSLVVAVVVMILQLSLDLAMLSLLSYCRFRTYRSSPSFSLTCLFPRGAALEAFATGKVHSFYLSLCHLVPTAFLTPYSLPS